MLYLVTLNIILKLPEFEHGLILLYTTLSVKFLHCELKGAFNVAENQQRFFIVIVTSRKFLSSTQ